MIRRLACLAFLTTITPFQVVAFQVNTYTPNDQSAASIAADGDGNFVVVWSSSDEDGDDSGVFAQRYDSLGISVGTAFRVNTQTAASQRAGAASATVAPLESCRGAVLLRCVRGEQRHDSLRPRMACWTRRWLRGLVHRPQQLEPTVARRTVILI